jgi:hypothetical protein
MDEALLFHAVGEATEAARWQGDLRSHFVDPHRPARRTVQPQQNFQPCARQTRSVLYVGVHTTLKVIGGLDEQASGGRQIARRFSWHVRTVSQHIVQFLYLPFPLSSS